jgi:hypothetical protein
MFGSRIAMIVLVAGLAGGVCACKEDDPCPGKDLVNQNGTCVKAGPDGAPVMGFGETCTDGTNHTDCDAPTDYCAVMPGQAQGFCTAQGCDVTPSLCPMGWSCFDLSQFDPSLPHICIED